VQNLIYPLEIPKYYLRFQVSDYSRQSLLTLGRLNTVGNIIMPLPTNLVDAHNVDYDQQALGTLLGSATNTIAGMGPGRETANQLAASQNLGRAAVGLGIAGGQSLTTAFGSLAGSLINPARALAGMSPNQFLTILLQGPKYKTFEFAWRLSPKTPNESKVLKDIRRAFNNYMAPGLFLGGAIFTFPRIFQIAIMPNSQYMYKFKPSVLRSFSINFTPASQAAFLKAKSETNNLNAPEGVDISMSFIELEYWLDGDFKDNNDPYDTTYTGPIGTEVGISPAPPPPPNPFTDNPNTTDPNNQGPQAP
jgi:hypothetical protein